ncbi:hypothetical protein FHX52_2749 [Humibacillus xanthopallidus]|uniref:Uncharacterized protein n=1 Tax=Humibacillus xanthopallidus TaxID=412689 RepID=A0A543PPP4_9MICO|nr:hypothetical protein [Humibacillus xanthopallidus]TQN46043.1 hypothetical protein FHX52_2749 [Humibacillus xanthopallidus]
MDTTPSPAALPPAPRSALRRGLSAAGAAVVVAFVGTAGLGVAQAHAAGVSTGLSYAAQPGTQSPRPPHPPRKANHPANLPAATTTAFRYSFRDGQLIRL